MPAEQDRPFDAILFDAGGTLMYFDAYLPEVIPKSQAALVKSLQQSGLELDWPSFLKEFQARLEAYFSERDTEFIEYTTAFILGQVLADIGQQDVPATILQRSLAEMYAVSQAYWLVEQDAILTLKDLKDQGYLLGLISNASDDDDVQALVDKAGIREFFDCILSSAALGIRKPNPRIFHTALDRLGVSPARAAMVGDTLGADILGAKNAGLYAIWITRRAETTANRAHRDTIQPDATIATLEELPDLLKGLGEPGSP